MSWNIATLYLHQRKPIYIYIYIYIYSRIVLRTPQIISQLLSVEEQISSSHLKEKINEEHVAVSKIKVDPKALLYVC